MHSNSDDRGMDVPQSKICSLDEVEDSGNSNDSDDTIPEVPCKCITRDLQIGVIEHFA